MRPHRTLALLPALVLVLGACAPAGGGSSPTSAATTASPPTLATPRPPAQTPAPTASPIVSPAPKPPPQLAWTQLEPAGDRPDPREDHTWTVDGSGQTAWLFGGRDGDRVRGDLWAFDLETSRWRRVRPAGDAPPARFGHEAAWVEGTGLVLYAGQAGPSTFFGDLWAYDPADGAQGTWRLLPARGDPPVPRYGSCMALGPDGRLWISHGFTEDGTRFADTRAYDLATGTWTDESPSDGQRPVARCLHGCWFEPDGRFVIYAGQTTGVAALRDLWTLDVSGAGVTWTRVEADVPDDRRLYAHAGLPDGRRLVFGGGGLAGRFHDDLFAVDPATLAFAPVPVEGSPPPARAAAELIVDAGRARALLFGGKDATRHFGDLWAAPLPAGE